MGRKAGATHGQSRRVTGAQEGGGSRYDLGDARWATNKVRSQGIKVTELVSDGVCEVDCADGSGGC